MSETRIIAGGQPIPSAILVTRDATLTGSGSADNPLGVVPTPVLHDDTLTGDGSSSSPLAVADLIGNIVYGGGNDGVPILDGRVLPFATFLGGVYTLIRDIFLSGGVIVPELITLYGAGFKIFCNGRLLNFGTIHIDGRDAVGAVAGGSSGLGTLGIGTAGGIGRVNNTGANGTNQSNVLGDAAALGECAGGNGGNGGIRIGGTGGTYNGGFSNGGANFLLPMMTGFLYSQTSGGNQAQLSIIGGGAGGGSGGSDSGSVTSGAGGGGGGVLEVHALELWNYGVIRVSGGRGGDASGSSGNAGGGGGGGGGILNSLARRRQGSGLYVAPAGPGGIGFGSGGTGGGGRDGHVNLYSF